MKSFIDRKIAGRICAGITAAILTITSFGAYVSAEEIDNEDVISEEVIGEEITDDEVAFEEASENSSESEIVEEDIVSAEPELVNDVEGGNEDDGLNRVDLDESEVVTLAQGGVEYVLSGGSYKAVTYTGTNSNITIPEKIGDYSVTAIADDFLYNKDASLVVTSVTIPYTVTSIGNNAFRGCTKLQNVSFQSNRVRDTSSFLYWVYESDLRTIGTYAFAGDTAITSIDLSVDGVTTINAHAFDGCTGITTLKFPRTIATVGEDAFNGLDNLNSFYYYGDVDQWMKINFTSHTKGTHPNAYAKSVNISTHTANWGYDEVTFSPVKYITIPSSLNKISGYLFANFTSLISVDLSNVININDGAFYNCSSLETATFGEGLSILGDYAFYGNTKLKTITIGGGLSKISSKAFYNCKALSEVTIDKNVSIIVADAFEGCDALHKANVYYQSTADDYFSNVKGCYISYLGTTSTSENQADSVLYGYSATFDGRIGMRFYFNVNSPSSTDCVKFLVPTEDGSEELSLKFTEADRDGAYYVFTIPIAPKFASRKIAAKVESSKVSNPRTYWISFYDYASILIRFNNTYGVDPSLMYILRCMLSYCDAVQNYLDFDAGTIDVEKYGVENISTADSYYKAKISDSGYIGMAMVMNDTISLKLYFKGKRTDIGIDTEVPSFNSNNVTKVYENGYTVITVNDFKILGRRSDDISLSFKREIYLTYNGVKSNDYFYGVSYAYEASMQQDEKLVYLGNALYTLTNNVYFLGDYLIRKK